MISTPATSDTLNKIKTPRIGETLILSSKHWIKRKEKNVFVSTFINLVGGSVSRRHKAFKDAHLQVERDNNDMEAQGRL